MILLAARWYLNYNLSYRDLEDLSRSRHGETGQPLFLSALWAVT